MDITYLWAAVTIIAAIIVSNGLMFCVGIAAFRSKKFVRAYAKWTAKASQLIVQESLELVDKTWGKDETKIESGRG